MKLSHVIKLFCSFVCLAPLLQAPAQAQEAPPPWAYHITPNGPPPLPAKVDDGAKRTFPGSEVSMTLTETRNRFFAPDWHPTSHPPMPESVLHGRKPNTYACGFCHRAEGQGVADSANISGLSKDYIVRQVQEMRSHARQTAVDQRLPMVLKSHVFNSVTDEEIIEAATYFSSLPARSYVKVVETDVVPKTVSYLNLWLVPTPDGETEPLGQRIIEIPDDLDRAEMRDTRAPFTAYVPRGSIERGRALAESGGEAGLACAACHGEGLKGGIGPRLAGHYATYLVRQLHDLKTGRRKGEQAGQMAATVEKLTLPDMIALAAYAASLTP
jgi:cytochrome c553